MLFTVGVPCFCNPESCEEFLSAQQLSLRTCFYYAVLWIPCSWGINMVSQSWHPALGEVLSPLKAILGLDHILISKSQWGKGSYVLVQAQEDVSRPTILVAVDWGPRSHSNKGARRCSTVVVVVVSSYQLWGQEQDQCSHQEGAPQCLTECTERGGSY